MSRRIRVVLSSSSCVWFALGSLWEGLGASDSEWQCDEGRAHAGAEPSATRGAHARSRTQGPGPRNPEAWLPVSSCQGWLSAALVRFWGWRGWRRRIQSRELAKARAPIVHSAATKSPHAYRGGLSTKGGGRVLYPACSAAAVSNLSRARRCHAEWNPQGEGGREEGLFVL